MTKINKFNYIKLFLGFLLVFSMHISPVNNGLTANGESYDVAPPNAPNGFTAESFGQSSDEPKSASYDKTDKPASTAPLTTVPAPTAAKTTAPSTTKPQTASPSTTKPRSGYSFANNTELGILDNYVDYATIMTYDIHGPWDNYTDFNAPLYKPTEYSPQSKTSVDSAVKQWIGKGFSASKIVLGVPFYGHMYSGVNGGGNGLYNTYASSSSVSYDKIVSSYLNNSAFTKYYHSDARVPWLFNGSTFISYDNENSIVAKAQYIKSNNLAGACAWELSQNKNGVLVNSLYSTLN
ncbi:MAG: glycoside hydrolase family 18 protein [Clostridiales bacterium]|nr:glycoside hydrolase family 18 protein [Clostridiales bacterium]